MRTVSFSKDFYYILCFLFLQFLKEVTNTICDMTIEQPSSETVKQNILYTPGPVVSYRAFKHGKRSSRSIAETEYQRPPNRCRTVVLEELQNSVCLERGLPVWALLSRNPTHIPLQPHYPVPNSIPLQLCQYTKTSLNKQLIIFRPRWKSL